MSRSLQPDDSGIPFPQAATTQKEDIIRILQPLVEKRSIFTAADIIIQIGIATIIVLEYSAFLPHKDYKDLKRVRSAVDYYLKSSTAAVVKKGAKEISRRGYKKEELEQKILEFILENCMSKDMTSKK